jgi:hypothetical protein
VHLVCFMRHGLTITQDGFKNIIIFFDHMN